MKKILGMFILSSVVGLGGNVALAQYGSDYGSTGVNAVGAGLGIGLLIFWVIFMLISLAITIFWLVMLIDCIRRNFDQKVMWIVLIIILGWLGAIVYYFAVKRKNVGGGTGGAQVSQPSQPTTPQPPTPPTQTPPAA